ncbi:hypothetical protein [Microbulbifer sp.]|uniref:hypothetical protein n=1 Tax=Microbulbifer sp. TaxID=1908541 RepID=UPI003F34360D
MHTFNFRKITVVYLLLISSVISGCDRHADKTELSADIVSPSEMFKQGVSTPIDLLFLEAQGSELLDKYYLSELTMNTSTQGEIGIIDLYSNEKVMRFSVDIEKPGLKVVSTDTGNQRINELVLDNYTEWCGKWHKGINNYWQFCTGSDCTGSGTVQWCIKKVDKETCEQAGNCPTND